MGGDAGLEEAIRAVGGVTELARRIGISQPSVSNWSRVPADRIVAVEAATGVTRAVLRPDLYADATDAFDDTAVARSQEYALLAALLAHAPDAQMLKRLAAIESDGTPLGLAHEGLAGAAAEKDPVAVAREYFDLFIGVGRGELLPYGSYYLTGFLHERPLARLRADLVDLGIERIESQCEPEDHAAILCEIMAGLVAGEFAGIGRATASLFRAASRRRGSARFFADLESAEAADFYRPCRHDRTALHRDRNTGIRADLNRKRDGGGGERRMKAHDKTTLGRRSLLRDWSASAPRRRRGRAAGRPRRQPTAKSKARSARRAIAKASEVKTYYRVNRYPR